MFHCRRLDAEDYERAAVPMDQLQDPKRGIEAVLSEYGYAIVTGVLTREECYSLEHKDLAADLNELIDTSHPSLLQEHQNNNKTRLQEAWEATDQHNPDGGIGAWPQASLSKLGPSGFVQRHGMPHSRFSWKCRLHPRVRQVYQVLHQEEVLLTTCAAEANQDDESGDEKEQQTSKSKHETDDGLVTGFDNMFVSNRQKEAAIHNRFGAHVDIDEHDRTSGNVSGLNVYQGLLYLWSSESERSSTTVIWPKSHQEDVYGKIRDDMKAFHFEDDDDEEEEEAKVLAAVRSGGGAEHFCPLAGMSSSSVRNELIGRFLVEARRITVPAGALLVWDIRTVHQGWNGGLRLAQPVCWEPRARRSNAARVRKLIMAALGLPSTHWASLGLPHNASVGLRKPPEPVSPSAFGESLVFPMRATIKSQALKEEVDPMELWEKLENIRMFGHVPDEIVAMLEDSIKEEYLAVI